ncbi:estradiol 17 beta-dehydrogenase 8-like protein [Leptotrombidium deliense]|uniref:(3R)-3-hydroxyacyl-CoA dehydrogenase n=1 Tax=Leptotrombidium deliense TaxID=299467 RepID=A0A443SUJ4_9ACAR|nr:estradiol 17 beta-dehydrogenase 8-like protein [Leptotrombidium deliense]
MNYGVLSAVITRRLSSFAPGRVAVVTGGGSGIGRAVCELLSKEKVNVAVADISEASARQTCESLAAADLRHSSVQMDVSNSSSVEEAFYSVVSNYKTAPSILVNCAGITRDAFMSEMSEDDFDKVIDVNLKGTFLTTKIAYKYMVEHNVNEGSIVHVSSISGKIGNLGQCNYSASKAAVEAFTRTVAKEMAIHNIRCNAVMPGFIKTPIVLTVPEKVMKMLLKMTPIGRLGKPEEVAEAIVFLASSKSSYITGTTLQVSGGLYM